MDPVDEYEEPVQHRGRPAACADYGGRGGTWPNADRVIEMKLAIPFSQTKESTNYQVSETAGQDTDADGDEDVGRIPQTLIPICPETRSISYRTMTGVSQNKLKFMV